ncbi:MAG: Fic family protein [Alphaproteobacteria bacterium]|jgi:Fic family protein|nr:Fic family protein [Alphaproteobacteria bacterium]
MDYTQLDNKLKKIAPFLNEDNIYKKDYLDHLNVKLTYHSNAIEGNTLSELETALVIDEGIAIGGKTLTEHFEAINHYKAFNYIFQRVKDKEYLGEIDILKIHEFILNNINDEKKGIYRDLGVRIRGSNSIFPNYAKVPTLMSELDSWLKANQNLHPIVLASEAHYRLVSIHPFVDGNGRTSRLLMNGILMQKKFPPLIIVKEDRSIYLESLEQKRLKDDSTLWDNFIYQQMDKTLDYFIDTAKDFVEEY